MADDTYPEELYIAEIEIVDFDDAYWWGEWDLPEPNEWEGEYYQQDDESDYERERDNFNPDDDDDY